MSNPRIYYAIYDGMEQKLITFVEKERTKKPLISGGGNLGFIKLVSLNDYEYLKKQIEQLKADLRTSDLNRQSLWADSLKLVDDISALKSKLAKAKLALEFYGSPKTYFYVEHPDGLEGRGDITVMKDLGNKAINALSEIGEG